MIFFNTFIISHKDSNSFPDGESPLHFAKEIGNEQIIDLLLQSNANVEKENSFGEVPDSYKKKEKKRTFFCVDCLFFSMMEYAEIQVPSICC